MRRSGSGADGELRGGPAVRFQRRRLLLRGAAAHHLPPGNVYACSICVFVVCVLGQTQPFFSAHPLVESPNRRMELPSASLKRLRDYCGALGGCLCIYFRFRACFMCYLLAVSLSSPNHMTHDVVIYGGHARRVFMMVCTRLRLRRKVFSEMCCVVDFSPLLH